MRTGEAMCACFCLHECGFCGCVCLWMSLCNQSLCLAAREAGGRDSDREGQMETKTTVCHGCRSTGNPSFPLRHLSSFLLLPSFSFSSSLFFFFLLTSLSLFLSCRLLSICSSLPVPFSDCYSVSSSGICLCICSLLIQKSYL